MRRPLLTTASAASLLALLAAGPAHADPAFWRCVQHGRVTYQDTACPPDPDAYTPPPVAPAGPDFAPVSPGTGLAAGQEAPSGNWRGQTQFQASEAGQNVVGSHSVVPLEIALAKDGKVTGSSPDNGCRLLGVWASGGTPRLATLDVTLSGCVYAGYDQRYSGTLLTAANERAALLALQAYQLAPGRPTRFYDLKGTLRR